MKDIIDDVTELRTLVFEKLEQFQFAGQVAIMEMKRNG